MDLDVYVSEILEDIEDEGMEALKRYSKKFDGYDGELKVDDLDYNSIEEKEKEALDEVIERVKKVHKKQKGEDEIHSMSDSLFGLIKRPIERVGIYVPGGQPLPSTLIMVGVPARLAGVDEIVVTTPPKKDGIDPRILYIAEKIRVDDIYKIGGVQAIGAMAYGVGMKKVDKISGPGNKYVNEAKRQVYGEVGIDGLAGPSEIAIVADETADKEQVKIDILAQLEHDDDAEAWLFTTSKDLGENIEAKDAKVKVLDDIVDCIRESNKIAPEHLEILTENPRSLLSMVKNAGAVYLNEFTPAAAADYFLGVNHVLPTGRAAKFGSVLTVDDFVKKISLAETGRSDFEENKGLGLILADIEEMEYHKKSIEMRKNAEEN
ncbi:MAG: histidinol dehydrogenase [Candidatus Thermoplasmatota archaeon]|nr:histidinol dehydrogenase [Candidatus Thermoplasmatota archaeon]MBS3789976.1 histidinol dehydrogenase [Candidatus Thermoplasmatota archaeon]